MISLRFSIAAAVVLAVLTTTACAGSTGPAPSRTPSSTAAASPVGSPITVAASAVGARSRSEVVSLHAMGTSTTTSGIPHAQLPAQGKALRSVLQEQVRAATRLVPPTGSAAARLATALSDYAVLAGELASWDPGGAALPSTWFTRLRAADAIWTQSMGELSSLSGRDLLAGLPTLSLPSS